MEFSLPVVVVEVIVVELTFVVATNLLISKNEKESERGNYDFNLLEGSLIVVVEGLAVEQVLVGIDCVVDTFVGLLQYRYIH